MKTVDIELIGLGDRGMTALRLLLQLARRLPIRITSLRDTDPQRVGAAEALLQKSATAINICGHDATLSGQSVPLTYICTDWTSHAALAIEAMHKGRHAAVEVPAALTLDELHALVQTSDATHRHCMMLENCCYDPDILSAIARIRDGEIGDIVHAEGTYYHTLGDRWTTWRLEMNRRQRGDLYPTHELAPICMALAPDRMQTLVSMDSSAATGPATYAKHTGQAAPDFRNGDHTVTLIRTEQGRTILLRHDVLTTLPYQRLFHVVGTRGVITVNDDGSKSHDSLTQAMNESIITALANDRMPDFTIRDTAPWCAVTPLSSLSIERGFAPVAFPQF